MFEVMLSMILFFKYFNIFFMIYIITYFYIFKTKQKQNKNKYINN